MNWADKPCKVWEGLTGNHGYGLARHGGKQVLAHRKAFFDVHGRWPVTCCCHHCDNRPCVEPSHLFEGTRTDNNRDMTAKGRHWSATQESKSKGERHGMSKLTAAQVLAIRASYSGTYGEQRTLAKCFCVKPCTIQEILSRKTWGHI